MRNKEFSSFSIATKYEELSRKKQPTQKEREMLWKLRRTLESRGIDPHSDRLIDLAVIEDNTRAVKKFIIHATDAEMHYAKKYFGDAAGKVKANAIGASELRQLGLTIADPKKLKALLNSISGKEKAINKKKRIRDRRRFIIKVDEESCNRIAEEVEIIDEYNEKDHYSADIINDINAYAAEQFVDATA